MQRNYKNLMKKKILIVEDEPSLLRLLSNEIKDLDYDVVEARDGEQALILFKKERPDLVLLDIVLPLMNGFDVLERIKIKQRSKVPVIIISNLSGQGDAELAKNLGALDYLIKSKMTITEIMIKVNKSLEG